MHLSIAMTTYNGAEFLQEQLDSFLTQTRQPDELVICDDGSADATLKVLDAFGQRAPFAVSIYCNEINLGHTRNFEKAMSLCSGDVIFLSDQDDVWDAVKIETVEDCFRTNPGIDVVINDAFYTDAELNHSGRTVLQKVLSVGGVRDGHIAGACTALTKRFRDFILPFPEDNCPQHDVYIHRWANMLGNKHVLDIPMQAWRIHGGNATTSDEMNQPEILPLYKRWVRTRGRDTSPSYRKRAEEFREMKFLLKTRQEELSLMPMARHAAEVLVDIDQVIEANTNRSALRNSGWFRKMHLILHMSVNGQYRHFKGFKSIARDIFG